MKSIYTFLILGILLISGNTLVFASNLSENSQGDNRPNLVSESKKQFTKSNDEYEDADKSKNEDVQI